MFPVKYRKNPEKSKVLVSNGRRPAPGQKFDLRLVSGRNSKRKIRSIWSVDTPCTTRVADFRLILPLRRGSVSNSHRLLLSAMMNRPKQSLLAESTTTKAINWNLNIRSKLFVGIISVLVLATFNQQVGHLSLQSNCEEHAAVKMNSQSDDDKEITTYYDQPRILLYVTTHLSQSHEEFLHLCWPYVLSNSKLVQMADVKVFLTGNSERQEADAEIFRYVFREKVRKNKFSIIQMENEGYQEGAIAAMALGHKNGWFEGYDWVVRVNPDVIIRNDTWLLETILTSDEENVTGIFVDCDGACNETAAHCNKDGYRIHSDFTAFKPSVISPTLQWNESENAEYMNRLAFYDTVRQGQDRWLFESSPDVTSVCRLSTKDDSPVSHYGTDTDGSTERCVQWYKQRNLNLDIDF